MQQSINQSIKIMSYKTIKLVFTFLLFITLQQQFARGCGFTSKRTVHVHNNLPANNNLLAHCYSKDDDLGYRMLRPGQGFNWSFCPNFFPINTLFACTFTWGSKRASFEAFKEKIRGLRGANYHWTAASDGIYLSGDTYPSDQQKIHDWINQRYMPFQSVYQAMYCL